MYCVICKSDDGVVRIVGPFDNRDKAIDWAIRMRNSNRYWTYTPDVLTPPPN